MLISYLSKFAPRKNKTVAVINNVVLLKHWQISRHNISNGVLEAKRLRRIEEILQLPISQIGFVPDQSSCRYDLIIHLVSRPFNLFENTNGTSPCGEDKHRRLFDDIFSAIFAFIK